MGTRKDVSAISRKHRRNPTRGTAGLQQARRLADQGLQLAREERFEEAAKRYEQALALTEAVAPGSREVSELRTNLLAATFATAFAFENHGNLDRALVAYERALTLAEALYDPTRSFEIATILEMIGSVHLRRGDLDGALASYRRASDVGGPVDPLSLAPAFAAIGDIHREGGDLVQALDACLRGLRIAKRVGPRSREMAYTLSSLAAVYRERGDLDSALDRCSEGIAIAEAIEPRSEVMARLLATLGLVHRQRGDLDAAIDELRQACHIAESLRARAGGQLAREAVFAQHQVPFQALIAVLAERGADGDQAEAFAVAERSRARALAELLAEGEIEVVADAPEPARRKEQTRLLAEERELRTALDAAVAEVAEVAWLRHAAAAAEGLASALQRERELEDALERLADQLRAAFPAYADLRYPQPASLADVQAALPTDTLLLSYDATGAECFGWAVRRDGFAMSRLVAPDAASQPLTAERLDALVEAAAPYADDPHPDDDPAARARLATVLLGPIPRPLWRGAERLVIVPDGRLHYLPFELLPLPDDPTRLLAERYPLSYAPSATTWLELQARRPPRTARRTFTGFGLGFRRPERGAAPKRRRRGAECSADSGATDRFRAAGRDLIALRHAPAEVQIIAERLGGEPAAVAFVDSRATKARVRAEAGRARYLHFATHGLFDDDDPLHSALVLAPAARPAAGDVPAYELLTVQELFGLRPLAAELVVASACQTGRGHLRPGEGLVGMARALLFAGAQSLLLSLWRVPDRETKALMTAFYDALGDGAPPAAALQRARAGLLRDRDGTLRDPASWAGFVLVGVG